MGKFADLFQSRQPEALPVLVPRSVEFFGGPYDGGREEYCHQPALATMRRGGRYVLTTRDHVPICHRDRNMAPAYLWDAIDGMAIEVPA